MSAGASVVSKTADIAAGAVAGGTQVVKSAVSKGAELVQSDIGEAARSVLEEEIEKTLAKAESRGGAKVSQEEIDRALEGLNSEVVAKAAGQLAAGDSQGAEDTMRTATGLSHAEVKSLVSGVSKQMKDSWNDSKTAQALEASFRKGLDDVSRKVASVGGPDLTAKEVRTAFSELDGKLLAEVSTELIAGRPEAAKRVLARETSLEAEDVDALINGASAKVEQRVKAIREDVTAAVEKASDYTQALLWAWWIGALLALVACTAGGAIGAASVEKLHAVLSRQTVTS